RTPRAAALACRPGARLAAGTAGSGRRRAPRPRPRRRRAARPALDQVGDVPCFLFLLSVPARPASRGPDCSTAAGGVTDGVGDRALGPAGFRTLLARGGATQSIFGSGPGHEGLLEGAGSGEPGAAAGPVGVARGGPGKPSAGP